MRIGKVVGYQLKRVDEFFVGACRLGLFRESGKDCISIDSRSIKIAVILMQQFFEGQPCC